MRRWTRILLGTGAFGVSMLAGVGASAALGRDSGPDPHFGAAERPVRVLEPVSVGQPPEEETPESGGGGSSGGGGGGGDSAQSAGFADATGLGEGGDPALPAAIVEARCGDGGDAQCAAEAQALAELARDLRESGGAPAGQGATDGEAGEAEEAEDAGIARSSPAEFVEALCGDAGEGEEDACREALGTWLEEAAGGDEPADEGEPAIVDLCAGPEPPDGCEGVGGTVHLASTHPPIIYFALLQGERQSLCRSLPPLADSEVTLLVVADSPLTMNGRYASVNPDGTTTEVGTFDGRATPEARAYFEADTSASPRTNTCATLQRPPDGSAVALYDVSFDAVREGEEAPASWSGRLLIPPPTAAPAEPERPPRPPIEISLSRPGTITVEAWLTPDEASIPVLASRDPDRPDENRCSAAENGSLRPFDYWPAFFDQRTPVLAAPGGPDIGEYSVRERHSIPARGVTAGAWDVCVRIVDRFPPRRVIDRLSVPVGAPERITAELFATGYRRADRSGGGTFPEPETIDVRATVWGSSCGQRVDVGELRSGREVAICSFSIGADDPYFGLRAIPTYESGEGDGRTALLAMPREGCPGFPPEECPAFYEVTIFGPRDSSSREVHGHLLLRLGASGGGGSTQWVIGDESSYGGGDTPDDNPRLDTGALRVQVEPSDPTGTLAVDWRTDRPADVVARADYSPAFSDSSVACEGGDGLQGTGGMGTEGRILIGGLCPGSRYTVNVQVRDPGEPPAEGRWYRASDEWFPEGSPLLDARAASARTERLPIELSFSFRAVSGRNLDDDADRKFIPNNATAGAGELRVGVSQSYDGHARLELWCGPVSDMGGTAAPTATSVGPFLNAGVAMLLYEWGFSFDCPNSGEQLRRDRNPNRRGEAYILQVREGIDVRRLLREGTVVVAGQSQSGDPALYLTAELTVTARVVPAGP